MRNYGLVLPKNYVSINETEMEYIDGGLQIWLNSSYLNKSNCYSCGTRYAGFNGLSALDIAQEIYAHAVAYYASPFALLGYSVQIAALTGPIGVAGSLAALKYIRSHANPVDVGGDDSIRVTVFKAMWYAL